MIKRKTRTYRTKLRLLTNSQHRQSIRFSLFVKTYGSCAAPMFAYVNGWQ